MFSIVEPMHSPPLPGALQALAASDEWERQFAGAKRELGAFVVAVESLFGPLAVEVAASDWMELAETVDLPLTPQPRDWRLITVEAARRLARRHSSNVSRDRSGEQRG